MVYLSIDLETTGLDAEHCQILEIGAILEDTSKLLPREECPTFHRYLNHGNKLCGEPFALVMNTEIMKTTMGLVTNKDPRVCAPSELVGQLIEFLKANGLNGKILAAGKNFALFDLEFLKRLPGFDQVRLHHRVLDPTILYTDFLRDAVPPNTNECKVRAGISGESAHRALDDAWDVICLLRKMYKRTDTTR